MAFLKKLPRNVKLRDFKNNFGKKPAYISDPNLLEKYCPLKFSSTKQEHQLLLWRTWLYGRKNMKKTQPQQSTCELLTNWYSERIIPLISCNLFLGWDPQEKSIRRAVVCFSVSFLMSSIPVTFLTRWKTQEPLWGLQNASLGLVSAPPNRALHLRLMAFLEGCWAQISH